MKKKSLGIRLTADEHQRICAAALAQGISVQTFVLNAVLAAVESVKCNPDEDADTLDRLFAGVRNGPPGYKKCGIDFAKWLEYKPNRCANEDAIEELSKLVQTLVRSPLGDEREWLGPVQTPFFQWCDKHFPGLLERIPRRRQRLFAEWFFRTSIYTRPWG
jgi:hypothetical protein